MLKVTIIGGGSTYTPELLSGFVERQCSFPVDELWLMDNDANRLDVVGSFVSRLACVKTAKFKVVLSNNQQESIAGASYVITQFRVGKMQARREDEYLARRHGLVGQETTGIGGMAKALRSIPVILDVALDIQRYASDALLVNFTNPSGLITEALYRYAPAVNAVGVCNAAISVKMALIEKINAIEKLGLSPEDVLLKTLGLNHLTWYYGLEANGKDYWPEIMRALINEAKQEKDPLFDPNTLEILGMLPNSYLRYYYYADQIINNQAEWPPSRAEEVMQVEANLLKRYQDEDLIEVPEQLIKRGGAYYSTVAVQLMNAHHNDLGEIHTANVRHNGAVSKWDKDWVLELPCHVGSKGVIPLSVDPLPLVYETLIHAVKAYEILTVEAAVKGDRNHAYQALLAHPLGPPANKIKEVMEDIIVTNQAYLPRFFN